MRSERIKFRLHIALAAMGGGALLLVASGMARDPLPLRVQWRSAAAPESGAFIPTAPTPMAPLRKAAPGAEAWKAASELRGPAAASAGMLAGIDPETGSLGMPSPDLRAKLAASGAFDRSTAGLTVVTMPNGSRRIDLMGRFQEYMVVRILPGGRAQETCVQGPSVAAALHGKSETPPAPAHEVR